VGKLYWRFGSDELFEKCEGIFFLKSNESFCLRDKKEIYFDDFH
jgi:hypothetical protein